MKTLHLYLTRQVLATLVMTVAVFTFVLLLGNVLKEILGLLVNRQATLGVVLGAVALLIPYVLVFALPMGMLTATLLVFGRFSADQELTAVRASGISLVALATPILILSVLMSGVCAAINLQIAPECRIAYQNLLFGLVLNNPNAPLPEGRFVKDFPGYIIYAGKVRGTNLEDVLFYQQKDGETILDIRAPKAKVLINTASNQISFEFTQAFVFTRKPSKSEPTSHIPPSAEEREQKSEKSEWHWVFGGIWTTDPIDFKSVSRRDREPKISEMSFVQLQDKLRELEQLSSQSRPVEKLTPDQLREEMRALERMKTDLTMPVKVQIHRQVAFSFACIGFTLIGIPLGIRAHRRETSAGVAIAIVLVLVYYSFIILGQALETRAELSPHLILWLPNFIFQAVGAVLLWRADRGH